MKKILIFILGLCLMCGLAFAQNMRMNTQTRMGRVSGSPTVPSLLIDGGSHYLIIDGANHKLEISG